MQTLTDYYVLKQAQREEDIEDTKKKIKSVIRRDTDNRFIENIGGPVAEPGAYM